MSRPSHRAAHAAFTLTEVLVACAVWCILGIAVFGFIQVATVLFTKNISTNYSHNKLRAALEEITDRVQTTVDLPTLITSSGTAVTTGSAAGIFYDRLLGDPYVVASQGIGLSATTTNITLTYSTNVFVTAATPNPGDVLLIDGGVVTSGSTTTTLRPMVSSVIMGTLNAGLQTISIALTAPLGSAITWDSSTVKAAKLVRREALIVRSNGSRNELRRYPSFESLMKLSNPNLDDSTQYFVITDQIGTNSSDGTPFSETVSGQGGTLLNLDLRIRGTYVNNYLANKEANEFSNFARIITISPLRQRPVD